MTAPTEREWQSARERGQSARRAGRSAQACPFIGDGAKEAILMRAWLDGWLDEDARRRKG
jgi:ribosome modulation factor